jgi:putative DNA methylase
VTDQIQPTHSYKPKLIEVSIPLDDISRESARDKSIRHGHPSTLHLWWARRPLAACRAVLFAQLVDDPSANPGLSLEEQSIERKRLHQMISELVKWESTSNDELLQAARREIIKSCGEPPPPILDPFAGGGSIPLEAQRLGLDACGRDLNPVAVLINKALIEIPPRWAGQPPVFPGAAAVAMTWPRTKGLAEDVLRYGQWICAEVGKRIGHLYPKIEISGAETTVISWIWARTITCPNPACGGIMPLVGCFRLAEKKRKRRYVEAIPEGKRVRFLIRGPEGEPREKTISKRGAECLLCRAPVPLSYVQQEGAAKRMGSQLMAIVAQGNRQRCYLPPDPLHAEAAEVAPPCDGLEEDIGEDPRNLWCVNYGLTKFGDLFTNRQLFMFVTLSELVGEARSRIIDDGGDPAYADAVTTYLALAVSRITDRHSALTTWDASESREHVRGVFARQSLPMTWDYAESNPFSSSSGNLADSIVMVAKCLQRLPAYPGATAALEDAAFGKTGGRLLVATDPPYYDNISYANLSDFYYVWLRRSLGTIHPDLMSTMLTPKDDEIVADPVRHGGTKAARQFYEERFEKAFKRIHDDTPPGYPISFFYAYKQTRKDKDGTLSTAWEILLQTLLRAEWMVTASWPIRTELGNRIRGQSSNALGSSIVLTCRPRPPDAPVTDRRGILAALRTELPATIRMLVDTGIGPGDLRQSMIGPGMKIYSRYARVNEPDGKPMSVGSALKLINQVFDAEMSQLERNVSAESRWCIDWFMQHGFDPGPFPHADTLAKSANADLGSLHRAGLISTREGKVTLVSAHKLAFAQTAEVCEWGLALRLAGTLHEHGFDQTVRIMAAACFQVDLEAVRELAYLIYTTADRNAWKQTAALFNDLGMSWPELETESRKLSAQSTQDPLQTGDS